MARARSKAAKGDLRRLLQTLHDRSLRKDAALQAELQALDEAQRLREEADILLAYQQESRRISGECHAGKSLRGCRRASATITIELDPRFTAVDNANRRYARYHKLQRAAR